VAECGLSHSLPRRLVIESAPTTEHRQGWGDVKIGGSRNGRLYATQGLTIGTWTEESGFEPRGRLPVPVSGWNQLPYKIVNSGWFRRLLSGVTGWYATTNVWPVGDRVVLATAGRYLFRSTDRGRSWRHVHTLPGNSGPMGTLPTALCRNDPWLYLAEYTLGDEPARILRSDDRGTSWSTHVTSGRHRHFHGVFTDPFSGRLWATAGDEDTECALGHIEAGRFKPVGSGSQRWRAVGLAFTPEAIVWGMDCSFRDSVGVFLLPRSELGKSSPEPRQILAVDNSVFFLEHHSVDGNSWIVLSTASETGVDRVAPSGAHNASSRELSVLAANAETGFETWYELASFSRRRTAGEYLPGVPAAGAYIYLTSCQSLGFAVNPFNTAQHHGSVLTYGTEELGGPEPELPPHT